MEQSLRAHLVAAAQSGKAANPTLNGLAGSSVDVRKSRKHLLRDTYVSEAAISGFRIVKNQLPGRSQSEKPDYSDSLRSAARVTRSAVWC